MGMAFDLRTIYAMTALACVVLGCVQGAAFFTGRFGRWLAWWSVNNILLGLASCLIVLREIAPDFLSISVGNTMTIVGCALLPVAIREFAGRKTSPWIVLLMAGLPSLPYFTVFTDPAHSMPRIVFSSAVCALFDMAVAWEARRLAREEKLYSAELASGLFALTATLYGARAMMGWWGSLGDGPLFHNGDQTHAALGLVAMLLLTLRCMVIMMMATERTQLQLQSAAYHDALTGVLNRAGMSRAFGELPRQPLGVLLIDIDNFKQLNDSCGHAVGDDVLKAFAFAAHAVTRPGDLVARHGGDEFVVVLPGLSQEEAAALAQNMRKAFSTTTAGLATECSTRPTLSIGVATGQTTEPETLEAILHKADQALYRRKRDGRDGVDVFVGELQAA
ncbi:diguanylate cyclase (GGDEF)-like protein [Neorhizobium sp. JUb45]|nr:diguanylate cyclase (GGDEF)-like protein [Neorhizobium sp. JUb45]